MFEIRFGVDGLERDNARDAVFRLILRNAEPFAKSLQISVERERGLDARQMPSLWVHAVVSQQWPVIPTNLGFALSFEGMAVERRDATDTFRT